MTSTASVRPRRLTARRLTRARPRLTPGRLGAVAALLLVLIVAGLWLRDSSLVGVRQVRVIGVSGPGSAQITRRLVTAARRMTTLDFSSARLMQALSGEPLVAAVSASTHFPHAVTLRVQETIPVAVLGSGGGAVAVDSAGRLLPHLPVTGLPQLPLTPAVAGGQVVSPGTRTVLAVLGAAPYAMLGHILSARSTASYGVVVQLRNGPALRFGDATQAARKWRAADGTLADPNSSGAAYIDVSSPDGAAAG